MRNRLERRYNSLLKDRDLALKDFEKMTSSPIALNNLIAIQKEINAVFSLIQLVEIMTET